MTPQPQLRSQKTEFTGAGIGFTIANAGREAISTDLRIINLGFNNINTEIRRTIPQLALWSPRRPTTVCTQTYKNLHGDRSASARRPQHQVEVYARKHGVYFHQQSFIKGIQPYRAHFRAGHTLFRAYCHGIMPLCRALIAAR